MRGNTIIHSLLLVITSAISIIFISCDESVSEITVMRSPAEYEKQEAIWFIWNPHDHKRGESNSEVVSQLLEITLESQKVVLAVADSLVYKDALGYLSPHISAHDNLDFAFIPSIQFWARDMGPVFVILEDGELGVADFEFNLWGYADSSDPDNLVEEAFDRKAAEHLKLPIIKSNIISEGGNREINSQGVLITVEKVETERNPTLTLNELEEEYSRVLGIQKTIWLKQGLKEDEHTFLGPIETNEDFRAYTTVTTNGHIDEFARFVNDSTILLAQVDSLQLASKDPIAIENHRRLEENYEILKQATDINGDPFEIIRIPMPDPIFMDMRPGDEVYDYIKTLDYQSDIEFPTGQTIKVIAAASYLNYIIANKVVLGQKYCRGECPDRVRERDIKAEQILQQAFPNRKIYMIDALAINLGGGGIHCVTIHQPSI